MRRVRFTTRCGAAALGLLLPLSAAVAASLAGEEFECLVEPAVTVKLGSPVSGILAEVPVDRGDVVEQGQVVARLESGVEQATVAIARARAASSDSIRADQARLRYQQRQEDRTRELFRTNTMSQENLDKVETERTLAELKLRESRLEKQLAELEQKRAQAVVDQRTIRSPVDGVVVERALYVGEYVNEQSHIVQIAQVDPLHVEVFLPANLYGQVQVGAVAEVVPAEPVGGVHRAMVKVVDPVIDAASKTFGVRLELNNTDGSVPPGIKCRVRFGPAGS